MEEVLGFDTRQFVVFGIGEEEYGVDIQKVTTIEQMRQITRVPKTPHYLKGVINLRGDIIPIVDLRKKFALEEVEYTEDTRIIIFKLEDVFIGIIVDNVAEVIQLNDEDIDSVTNLGNEISSDYILGVGKIDQRIVTLLNIEKLTKLDNDDIGS